MIALVDIGNTRTKFCFYDHKVFDHKRRTSVQVVANNVFNQKWFELNFVGVTKVVVANVSSTSLTEELQIWCQGQKISCKTVISEQKNHGVTSAYGKPEQLGVDRWLALIASAALYPHKNILIVDAGTATTIDLLSSSGQHVGGWILAGIDTLFTSVLENTSKVHASLSSEASLTFGTNTSENVNNACWAATLGAINLAISQAKYQSIIIDEILITGGNGQAIAILLSEKATVIDDLVFYGLQAYN